MDQCIKSFSFKTDVGKTFTGGAIKQWSIVGANFWTVAEAATSTINIQGFKNINLHGIKIIGFVQSDVPASGNSVIVNDWSLNINVQGTLPLIGAFATTSPNYFNLDPNSSGNNSFFIGKYSNEIFFQSPIESVTSIQIQTLYAQGIGFEVLGSISLVFRLDFIFYYNYEGED